MDYISKNSQLLSDDISLSYALWRQTQTQIHLFDQIKTFTYFD